jgi:hypothetical protein
MTPARKKKQPQDITPEPGRWVTRRVGDGHYFKADGFTSSDLTDAALFESPGAANAFAARERTQDETWEAVEHWRAAGYAADPSTATPTPEVSVPDHAAPLTDDELAAIDAHVAAVDAAMSDEPADQALEAEVVDGADDAWLPEPTAEPVDPTQRWRAGAVKLSPATGQPVSYLREDGSVTEDVNTAVVFLSRAECEVFLADFDLRQEFRPIPFTVVLDYPAIETTPAEDEVPRGVVVYTPPVEDPEDVFVHEPAGGSQQAFPGFEAAGAASAPTTGVALNAPGVARVLARAVKSYADDLEKEAKRVRDLGYDRESKVLESDATILREDVLQQLEPQARIPLGTVSLTQAIETRLQGKLRRRVRQALAELPRDARTTDEDHKAAMHAKLDDFEVVIGSVAAITTALVVGIVREAAARGIAAGRLAREVTPDLLGAQAVDVVTDRESA